MNDVTNIGMTTKEYKEFKGLWNDIKAINMSIVFADIAELTVRELVKKYKSIFLEENVK